MIRYNYFYKNKTKKIINFLNVLESQINSFEYTKNEYIALYKFK